MGKPGIAWTAGAGRESLGQMGIGENRKKPRRRCEGKPILFPIFYDVSITTLTYVYILNFNLYLVRVSHHLFMHSFICGGILPVSFSIHYFLDPVLFWKHPSAASLGILCASPVSWVACLPLSWLISLFQWSTSSYHFLEKDCVGREIFLLLACLEIISLDRLLGHVRG